MVMDVKESMRKILRAESEAILAIPVDDSYEAAVEAIVEHVHRRKGKLVTSTRARLSTATWACFSPTILCCSFPTAARLEK